MREVEIKAVVDNWEERTRLLERGGARLIFRGRLEDRRYDTPERTLASRDQMLRLRVYRDHDSTAPARAELAWKGPTSVDDGYKVREELQAATTDADTLADILRSLDYIVTLAIDRDIIQYEVEGATVRFEHYPRMDDLVEVEGQPEAIERAVAMLGLPRAAFSSERLLAFTARFETRAGQPAALCDAELAGPAGCDADDG
ncbi:MAG: class IV adenylate cyclase [Gemmatimonadota bacterium]|nr:class IV adenylate cyclase [Gemmatimonadota bacterium]